ncbi:MAG: Maf family protein [Erysipelotrichaceae bacterium]|nr:Maf family protein [Erysipelotrichaceae bacterium]MDY5252064.1 Maf family protein [Erysipelotrichaceae bacterium]
MKRIILASQSPRRKELLQKLDIPFGIVIPSILETIDTSLSLEEAIAKLAMQKAQAVLQLHPDAIVIGADTIVVYQNQLLGKPQDRQEALSMIKMLQGNTHQVITGVSVVSKDHQCKQAHISHVTFDPMSDEEINAYLDANEWQDKAGAYGIQGHAAKYISHIDGDYYSIMGLPINLLYKMLCQII